MKKEDKGGSSGKSDYMRSALKPNGAHVNKDRGKSLGEKNMLDIQGTEKVESPF